MTETSKAPQRRMMLMLLAVFLLPLVAAFVLYYGLGWRPAGSTNHGELLEPFQQLGDESAALREKWALVYVGDGRCDEDCRRALLVGRQTRLSLNQEMTRVNRALFATAGCCDLKFLDEAHAGIKVFDVSEPDARDGLLALLPPGDHRHHLFVVDPIGNIVLRFDTRQNPRGLLDDMKKLLKLSHIG